MSESKKYLDLEGLTLYDEKIKIYINTRDTAIKGDLIESDYQTVKALSDAINGITSIDEPSIDNMFNQENK